MLPADTVEQIYAAASAQAPLSEPASVAAMYAGLYARARTEPGVTMAIAGDEDGPVGFAYGHDWHWSEATDPWSTQLRQRLGEDAAQQIAESFAVNLLAVLPAASGMGAGRRLLEALVDAATSDTAWLQTTDIDSPARQLYRRTGWRTLGRGPDAPNGKPGLVLIHVRKPRTGC
ncbi:GNAT family N-acetyltransferase [Allobranchiibius sp. CTAmp26]|uniref:GNAT family N-acetyltransferase n=1 Tax=Allobranchiibius sp. CTAmp26 TaxID=2815214 RepID=UPI001AA0D0B3|nr:GNAT family N-acetyltransferase [Allobranchiibius sp. CTAmp26]MBO1756766.1 GNAT family N-acetyltransferase [Allobranchiibius sp. CTAmp26]